LAKRLIALLPDSAISRRPWSSSAAPIGWLIAKVVPSPSWVAAVVPATTVKLPSGSAR